MLNIAIVEDEQKFRDILKQYTERYAAESGEQINTAFFDDGMTFLEQYRGEYDIIFMDILMPHMNGMEAAHRLRSIDGDVLLVFITSMAQYAIKGYDVNASAFLVKPMGYKQLALVLDRLRKLIVRRGVTSVTVHQREGTRVLNLRDIAYVEVFNHSLVFHTADAAHEANGSLSEYESDNRFASFVKVSKSHLVNCAYITEIGDDFVTVAGDKLPLTRRRKKECLEKIAKVIGSGLT